MPFDAGAETLARDPEHEDRTLRAIKRALGSVPFYVKQDLAARVPPEATLGTALAKLPLLTREKLRPTLPKVWFPEGRDAKTELASGAVSVVEIGAAESRVRILFDARWWRSQERRALGIHPRAERALAGDLGPY